MAVDVRVGASFRDPSGFIFIRESVLLRQVNEAYRDSLARLNDSGLYATLTAAGLLIPHESVDLSFAIEQGAIAVLKPEVVRTISYPYEWCFSQLKDAALATLRIQLLAIEHGMTLRDASAYNIQFHRGKPTLIDSLSFEPYDPAKPWVPYRQFCQHFLAPLVLMSHVDVRLGRLSANFIDGIPLDLASALAKPSTRFSPAIGMHLHLHAQLQAKAGNSAPQKKAEKPFGKNALLGLIDSLKGLVEKLDWKPEGTEWADYYEDTNYSASSMQEKKRLVREFLEATDPGVVWDMGANNGEFSALAAEMGADAVAWDIDPAAVEKNYRARRGDPRMLPLVQDLTNPSPAIGWALSERESLIQRGPVDTAMALALVHHLAIGNNVPLSQVAAFFGSISKWLIVEFVPKSDSQVQRLLASREDVFPNYTQEGFEQAFADKFETVRRERIAGAERTLYLMRAEPKGVGIASC